MVDGPIDQGRFNALKLMRETSAISEPYLIDGAGKEQLRISRIPIELAATQQDYSRNPKFTEAMSNKFYLWASLFSRCIGGLHDAVDLVHRG